MPCPPDRPSAEPARPPPPWSLRSDIWYVQSRPPCQHEKADQKDRQNLFHTAHIQ